MNPDEYEHIRKYLKNNEVPSQLHGSHARFGFKRKCKSYMLDEETDIVYYISRNKDGSIKRKAKCVIANEDARAAFLEVHKPEIHSHPGLNRSLQALSQRFFWPRMTYDVTDWIRSCAVCKHSKEVDKSKQWKLKQLKISEPWEILTMDIIGPVSETTEGYKFIFTATDFYSKWVEAFPICNKFPAEVAACLKLIFYRHGACKSILSDECTEFIHEVNEELHKQLGVEYNVKAVYHPNVKTIDLKASEELHKVFLDLVEDHSFDWPHYIDGLLFTMRTKKNPVTKFTPFYLLHKREARMPPIPACDPAATINSDFDLSQILQPTYDSSITKDHVNESRCHQKVVQNVKQEQTAQLFENARNSGKKAEPDFVVGEKVLLSNQRKRYLDDTSQDLSYAGPYVIADIQPNKIRLLSLNDLTQTKLLQSADRLTRFRESFKLSLFES